MEGAPVGFGPYEQVARLRESARLGRTSTDDLPPLTGWARVLR